VAFGTMLYGSMSQKRGTKEKGISRAKLVAGVLVFILNVLVLSYVSSYIGM
jgi:hypothetical protein